MVLSAARGTHNSKLQQMVSPFRLDVLVARPPYTPSPQLNSESLGRQCAARTLPSFAAILLLPFRYVHDGLADVYLRASLRFEPWVYGARVAAV